MEYFYIEATTFHGNFCKKLIGIFVFGDTIFEIIVWNICPRPVVWLGSFLPLPQLWPLKKKQENKNQLDIAQIQFYFVNVYFTIPFCFQQSSWTKFDCANPYFTKKRKPFCRFLLFGPSAFNSQLMNLCKHDLPKWK